MTKLKPTEKIKKAYKAACRVRLKAHAPYSKYKVGSAVISASGKVFTGCNVENASYGGTICAERTAIFKAVSEGEKKISSIIVVTQGSKPGPPCAFCLQVMAEFCSPETEVWLASPSRLIKRFQFQELLPFPFGPSFLKS